MWNSGDSIFILIDFDCETAGESYYIENNLVCAEPAGRSNGPGAALLST